MTTGTGGGDLLGCAIEDHGDLAEFAGVLVLDPFHLFSVPLYLRMKKRRSLQNTGILVLKEISHRGILAPRYK